MFGEKNFVLLVIPALFMQCQKKYSLPAVGAIITFCILILSSNLAYADDKPSIYPMNKSGGWPELKVTIQSVDLWRSMPDGVEPQNGLFLVIVVNLEANRSQSCLYMFNYELHVGESVYKQPNGSLVAEFYAKRAGLETPGRISGQCSEKKDEPHKTFLWFDVDPDHNGKVTLNLDNGRNIPIADSLARIIRVSGLDMAATATPVPIPTATPTSKQIEESKHQDIINLSMAVYSYHVAISDLFDEADRDNSLIFSPAWCNKLTTTAGSVWNTKSGLWHYAHEMANVDAASNEDLFLAGMHYKNAAEHLNEWCENFEKESMTRAAAELKDAEQVLKSALTRLGLLDNFTEQLGEMFLPGSDAAAAPSVKRDANLRAGPGTNYDVVGSAKADQALDLAGKSADGKWLKLEDGKWISASLVNNIPTNLSIVE